MRPSSGHEEPSAYLNLGAALTNSGHFVEAAQRYLEAKERLPVGSEDWAPKIWANGSVGLEYSDRLSTSGARLYFCLAAT